MALERQPLSWPLTGGLASKDSPLSQVPGTHSVLRNARQVRSDEWIARGGWNRDALDDFPTQAPARIVEVPGGGAFALSAETGFAPAGLSYVPSVTSGSRWNRSQSADCSQSTPSVWSRRSVMSADTQVLSDYCEGSVYSLAASAGNVINDRGLVIAVSSKADGIHISDASYPAGLVSATGVRPRCILGPSDRLCLVYIDTASTSVIVNTWSGSTGANLGAQNLLGGGASHATHFLDAWWYGGTTITIVFRTGTGVVRFLEYDPVTTALGTNVTLGNVDTALSLLPDPDASGIRFVASSDSVLNTRVQRLNSAGAIQTTDPVFAGTATAITGVGYAAGASWMVVYDGINGGGGISAVKKRTGVISAALALVPGTLRYRLDSGGWRETGADLMRFIAGIHTVGNDAQSSYFEMALPFDTGATMVNLFPEPQSRLLPLNAGGPPENVYPGGVAHAQRVGTGKFVMALPRLVRFGRQGGGASANQYAVDQWMVTAMPASGLPTANLGPGLATGDAAYLPAGSLLTTVDGKRVVAHGLCTAPLQPVLTPAAGAGLLTALALYQHQVVVEVPDENGRPWRSPPSTIASVTLTGGQNQISVAVTLSVFELPGRIVTAKIYRTKGNGSVFQLVNARTGTISSLQSFTFLDQVSDANLSASDFLSAEAAATITPAFSHVAFWNGRMWGIDRDFPTRVWFSKPVQYPFQPEFPGVGFQQFFDDEFGDCTGLAALDDKLVVAKRRARYVVQGDGPDNTGAGSFSAARVGSDWGCIPGGVLVSTGEEIFSTTERGIWRMDRSLQSDYVGSGIDQWLAQPTNAADFPQQTIIGGHYDSTANEVRFLTANNTVGQPKQFVYDRLRSIWFVDDGTGLNAAVFSKMLGTRQVLVMSDGRMLTQQPFGVVWADAGVAYASEIRSAWIRPAGDEGRIRVYKARVLASQPAPSNPGGSASTPTLSYYRDNDLTLVEAFVPLAAVTAGTVIVRAEGMPRFGQCSTFMLGLSIPSGSAIRLDKWGVEFGLKPGVQKLPSSQRWRSP